MRQKARGPKALTGNQPVKGKAASCPLWNVNGEE